MARSVSPSCTLTTRHVIEAGVGLGRHQAEQIASAAKMQQAMMADRLMALEYPAGGSMLYVSSLHEPRTKPGQSAAYPQAAAGVIGRGRMTIT